VPKIPTFEEYVANLGDLTPWIDPTTPTAASAQIQANANALEAIDEISRDSLTQWVAENPKAVNALALTVGLTQEKFKIWLKKNFNTESWAKAAAEHPAELIEKLDQRYDLIRLVESQRKQIYSFGDLLVARGGTRGYALTSAKIGRDLEDKIEAIARELGLDYETRTRFVGRHNETAPCDLVIPNGKDAVIAVAAKVFGSTGSKQSAAWKEVQDMSLVRKPSQYIMAVIDGVGWVRRISDLKRIYELWAKNDIDGMYTVATLDSFRADLEEAARRHRLL
jgi:hypothetical protein